VARVVEKTKRSAPQRADAVGVDTGGTFTDVVLQRGGERVAFKIPSTPHAPELAVLEGLSRALAEPPSCGMAPRSPPTPCSNAASRA
jgi:hypothetical protein